MLRPITTLLVAILLTLSPLLHLPAAMANENTADNHFWWPDKLNLQPLRQHSSASNPLGEGFNYADAFTKLDLNAVKKDIEALMKESQPWWPADYGHYGPFFIRMAWHSAGTYRQADGRGGAGGGQQRFEQLNSWPDNANLDKARRLLWPLKQKYGNAISWADLMVLTGNVALESMGFKTLGFAGGRQDDWEADRTYWGPETTFMADKRHSEGRKLENPLAATQMGLIYVNPEGPNGNPDPLLAAQDIRVTFGRMAMNDEETVALIAGGHTFGKVHGAHKPADCLEAEPAAAGLEAQGFGWNNKCGKGNAEDTVTSGLEGAWTTKPTEFTMQYLDNLFGYEWEQTKSPAGAIQWKPKGGVAAELVPDAHVAGKKHPPMMLTTDLALKVDPSYRSIAKRFQKDPAAFEKAFAQAWFKLTHRDMGPQSRYLGQHVPKETFIWQDPLPAVDYKLIDAADIQELKEAILASGLTGPELIRTAWASAVTFRGTDMRGGANGARLQLAPQKDWAVNNPDELHKVLTRLEKVQKQFNSKQNDGTKVSLADIIVLGGAAAIEQAASKSGHSVTVPFAPGRVDASQQQTDVAAFAVLEPQADAFRNYYAKGNRLSPTEMLVERASMLNLSIPEMTVLLGGMRALDANAHQTRVGVLTKRPGTLSNDFFINLLDMETQWSKSKDTPDRYEGRDRKTGKLKWMASPVDLVFGADSELRAVAEVYAFKDAETKFMQDFIAGWVKVMQLDRFDIKAAQSR